MNTNLKDSELITAFLEVDRGDATIVLIPGGSEAILIDCGHGSSFNVVNFLEHAKVRVLKLVVISHSDLDHAGDIVEVINNFRGQTEYLAFLPDRVRQADVNSDRHYRVILREIAQLYRDNVAPYSPYANSEFNFDELKVSILHPSQADVLDALAQNNHNDASVVIKLQYQGRRILLAADVQGQGWQWMKERGTDLSADVFKYPHHGAWHDGNLSPNDVLDLVYPSLVVISTNSYNQYDHPSEKTIQLLRQHIAVERFACTQATKKCHPSLSTVASKARILLDDTGWQTQGNEACPCAGTVLARISKGNIEIIPSLEQHNLIMSLFGSPQCRE